MVKAKMKHLSVPLVNYKSVFKTMRPIILGALICISLCTFSKVSHAELQLPFKPINVPQAADSTVVCMQPDVKPPKSLYFESIYNKSDSKRAIINPAAQKKYREQSAPFIRFENKIIAYANAYQASAQKNSYFANCTIDWLYHWARQNALLGRSNEAGEIMRQWSLASIASAYAQVKSEPMADLQKKKKIEAWLKQITQKVINFYPNDTEIRRKKNNHLYWAAWAVTMSGIALDDDRFFGWGINRTQQVIENEILPDGTFPLEMSRGSKALQYHNFAIMPLVMIAEAGFYNGVNLYQIKNGRLHIAVKRVLKGLDNPKYFRKKTEVTQDKIDFSNTGLMAWMEVYNARFPTYSARKWIKNSRPLISRRLGGNMSLLYKKVNAATYKREP